MTTSEVVGCLAEAERTYGEHLLDYTTTAAAHDVQAAIERARSPGVPVYVYGVSYGTLWVRRWLELAPSQADGVIFDSVCTPGHCSAPNQTSLLVESIGGGLWERCRIDPVCRERFGPDPEARARAVIDGLATGVCPELRARGLDANGLRRIAGSLLPSEQLRRVIPALFARIERCSLADQAALAPIVAAFAASTDSPGSPSPADFSSVLYSVVTRSELWEPGASETSFRAALGDPLFTTLDYSAFALIASAPHYVPDALASAPVVSDVPALILAGDMDPQTSVDSARALAAELAGPSQTLHVVAGSAHGVIAQSPSSQARSRVRTCGMDLLEAFLRDPVASSTVTCATEPIPFDDDTYAPGIFGTMTLWGGTADGVPAPRALRLEDLRLREEMRRLLLDGARALR